MKIEKIRKEKNLNSKLYSEGVVLLNSQELPLNPAEWEEIQLLTEEKSLSYQRASYGDTQEKAAVSYFRIKVANDETHYQPRLMEILSSNKMQRFFELLTGIKELYIDRCQSHLYVKGDFLEKHCDKESTDRYLFTVILFLSDEYEGGEFVVYHLEKPPVSFKPQKYSMLITETQHPHEVKEILSGTRKTLVFFLQ